MRLSLKLAWAVLLIAGIAHAAQPMSGVSLAATLKQGKVNLDETDGKGREPWVQQVGLHPQVFYFHNFLTEEERTHIIRVAAPMMKRSTVVGDKGSGVVDDIRTSYGMFIKRLHDPIIERVERRIALFTHVPVQHQEEIQVLRYTKGQKYGAHYDSSYDKDDVGPHHRLATFYMYLSDVEEGGETAFPKDSQWYDPAMANMAAPNVSPCAKGHVHAKPKAGDAALFYSFYPNGTMDPASMHTGCPVIKGIKWGAPVWIHIDEFNPQTFGEKSDKEDREPGMCEDFHDQCPTWAKAGECKKNPGFMTGINSPSVGTCRRSCAVCTPCAAHDNECIQKNRRAEGFLKLDREEMEWLGVKWWYPEEPSPEL